MVAADFASETRGDLYLYLVTKNILHTAMLSMKGSYDSRPRYADHKKKQLAGATQYCKSLRS